MHKVALVQSISKQYLSAKNTLRLHKKALSMVKLVVVSCICLTTFAVYAVYVSSSSTEGWKLKDVQKKVKNAEFDHSIAKLDVLQEEGKLFEATSKNTNYWYDKEGSLIVVDAVTQVAVK
jgi:hypothetical protein